ncbi:MAG: sugar transporter permease [Firmicutes bacterium]|nr:sugar transporter permease [Bacillota bacterium]
MKKGERRMIIAFVLPVVIVYLIFYLYPTVRTVYMSFFKTGALSSAASKWNFVGFDNYIELIKKSIYLTSFLNVFKILVIGGIAVFTIALFFAVIMQDKFRGRNFLKSIIYLPNIITPIALVVMWTQYIFSSNFGLLKKIFTALNLKGLAGIPWTNPEYSFWAMLIAFCFGSVGYYMIIYMAAMEQIPKDYYECASLEGANKLKQFWKITLPLLKETTKTCLIFWAGSAINFFTWSRVFNANPLNVGTIVPASYMYTLAFGSAHAVGSGSLEVGQATAIGVMLTLCILIVYAVVYKIFGKEKYEY